MPYPDITEYNDAVQSPQTSFKDPRLRDGTIQENNLGLPHVLSGGFALTYALTSRGKKFAVRCFHQQIPSAESKYAKISEGLKSLKSSYFVDFNFQSDGILVKGNRYPIVVMDWVEGKTLQMYLNDHSNDGLKMQTLRKWFAEMSSFLEASKVAHGDIQNENVIVTRTGLRLIDYDGMFVSGMSPGFGSEIGNRYFQHPNRKTEDFGPLMDRFSFIAVDLSLKALAEDHLLYRKFGDGGATIVFKANDFVSPSSSEIFRLLLSKASTRRDAEALSAICQADINAVPSLTDFLARKNIPSAPIIEVGKSPPVTGPPKRYLGAFPVVFAPEFASVMSHVGDKVELVGKILEVKNGIGKWGKGRNKPYVFINFNSWRGDNVKITVWSEALATFPVPPDASWAGKWISVVGLIDPPYQGKNYETVGIAIDNYNQIVEIIESEALFRLGRATTSGSPSTTQRGGNKDIIERMRTGAPQDDTRATAIIPRSPSGPGSGGVSSNKQIIKNLGQHTQKGPTPASKPQATSSTPLNRPPSPPQRSSGTIPRWVFVAGGLILLWFLFFLNS